MKRIALLLCLALTALGASAQSVYSAKAGRNSLSVGATVGAFQPDYAGYGVAETSPNRLYGMSAFVDFKINRWIQVEGEGRWLNYNEYNKVNENSYLVGPRLPIRRFGRATPYAKALIGMSSGSFLNGHSTTYALGGGVDYRLTKHITWRAADFEYQEWKVTNTKGNLFPYGISSGVSYRIF
jgi:opacity protein-like surface antigen